MLFFFVVFRAIWGSYSKNCKEYSTEKYDAVQFSKQALTLGETFFSHQNTIMLFYHENGEWLLFYMLCSFSTVRMRECEVSPVVKTYTTKWPIHRRQVSSSSLACFWYIHREEWLHTSIWQMTIHSVSDHLPYFSKRMTEKRKTPFLVQ